MYRVQDTGVAFAVPRRLPVYLLYFCLLANPLKGRGTTRRRNFPHKRAKRDHKRHSVSGSLYSILSQDQENGNRFLSPELFIDIEQEYHAKLRKANVA